MSPVFESLKLGGSAVLALFLMQIVTSSPSAQADEKAPAPLKIVLVGDSTVAPKGRWGDEFIKLLKPQAQGVNLALGGRSSKSYRDEGHWKDVLAQKPDYMLIQFGHNDMPGKGPERETDPNTTFAQNMARYVADARAIGAKPILVTSLTRRRFGPDGRIQSDLVPYVQAVIQVAKDNHVPLVDLNARSIEQLDAIGPDAAAQYDRPGPDPTRPDRTHLSEKGARATAVLVVSEVQRVVLELKSYFVALPLTAPAILAKPPLVPGSVPAIKPDFVVAADGSGQFKTVQEAVDAAPGKSERVVILIKPGTYKAHLVIPKDKTNLTFLGEAGAKTVLTNDWHVKTPGPDGKEVGTIGSASTVVSAPGFQAENITFENNAPHVAQALAIYVDGDQAEFRNCHFLGWQDTIRLRSGRQYFRACTIEGRTDFIYGEATAFFDGCEIHVVDAGWITAANTPQDHPYGFVFSNCKITGETGVKTCLGRPWRPFAATVWLNTQMENVIAPEGWNNWGNADNEKTVRYAEYNSQSPYGEPIDLSKRVAWAKVLTAEAAARYTPSNVLGDWKPVFLPPSPLSVATTLATTPQPAVLHPVFVLAGDSTVTDDAGWGAGFKALLKPGITLVNLARGGRSSRSFRDEGSWQKVLDLGPQYVLIQFGHNDEPGHGPDRETDAATTYKANIARYVDEARAKGIIPILVTPMTRRQFDATGKIHSSLAPYALSVWQVAQKKQVPLIDLHARSLAFFDALGPNKWQVYAPKKSADAFDGTHLNAAGSAAIAPLVVDELKKAVPALAGDFQ